MTTNKILPFASLDTTSNLLTDAEYAADPQRTVGNQPGVARSKLVNKALRQSSIIAAAVAEVVSRYQFDDVDDSLNVSDLADMIVVAMKQIFQVSVIKYGADPTGVSDSTTAFQSAIDELEDAVGSSNFGGGRIYVPSGKYKILGSLTINKSFITLFGDGVQGTYVEFVNGSQVGITIDGGVTGLRDVRILDMALNASRKTDGATVKVMNAYRCTFQNLAVEYCITGFDVGAGTNAITIRDTTIVPNQAASKYGVYWNCPVDGTTRSDALTLHNVVIECQWSNATCVMWEGFCNTMVATHLRLLHASYGMRIRNVTPSGTYYPQFLNAFDLEAEGFKVRALSIEAGACFKISGSDLNNLSGGAVGQGSADDYAVAIIADNGASYTRSIQIDNTRIGLCRQSGIYNEGWDVQLSNVVCVSTSMASIGGAPAVKLAANSRDVEISSLRGEEYGGAGKASYAVEIANGAQAIQLIAIDANYCQTGAVNNLATNSAIAVLGTVEPGSDGSSFVMNGNNEVQYRKNLNGALVNKVFNSSNSTSAVARNDLSINRANAYSITELNGGGGGGVFWQQSVGPGVAHMNWNAPKYYWRVNNVIAFTLGDALPAYANDAAAAAALPYPLPLYGYYWNTTTNAVVQRRT